MLITRVTLENIKSYRRATVSLGRGTTAIRGHNGAGKSTLVEAIGFALFDSLSYNRNQFVREGEKAGRVVVSFVSAHDDRLYEVERRCTLTGSGAWFVFDPELRSRAAEGKDDVTAFLRRHLGVESSVTLPALFNDAIAVQQGTFTADFVQTAALRKKKFDTLLQIEDYRKAAETLRDTERYLREAVAGHDRTIERLTAQTGDLDLWRAGRAELQAAYMSLAEQVERLQAEQVEVLKRCEAAKAQQAALEQLDRERERRYNTWQMVQDRARRAQEDAERTAAAQAICARTRADFERHLSAKAAHEQAHNDENAANALRIDMSRAEQAIQAATAAIAGIRRRIEEAEQAARERDRLAPLVERQQQLEEQRAAALQAQERLTAYQKERAQIADEIQKAQAAMQQIDAEIARLEALADLAALHATGKEALDALKVQAATLAERRRTRTALAGQLARQQQRAGDAQRAAEAAAQQVAQVRALIPEARGLDAAEHELALLDKTIGGLQADIDHADSSLHASLGGACPFLKEPCQNMARHGMSSLEDYFGDQIAQYTDAILQHQRQREMLLPNVQRLRGLQARVDRLSELEAAAQTTQTEAQRSQAEVAQLQASLAEIDTAQDDAANLQGRIKEAERLANESEKAERDHAQLPMQQKQRARTAEVLDRHIKRLAERDAAIAAEQERVSWLAALDADLQALGNPRRHYTECETRARQLDAIRGEMAQQEKQLQAAQKRLGEAQRGLEPYHDLKERIEMLQATLKQTQAAHEDYLRHEAEARRAPETQQLAAAALAAAQEAEAAFNGARVAFEAAQAAFDQAAFERDQQRKGELEGELAGLAERQKHHRRDIATLDQQIAEAEGRLAELRAAQAAREETDATLSLLSYCRDTIKEAGPFVMRAWLQRISGEANRIFGEIIGDRAATLSWQDDYDIVLRVGANERQFAQLSGGEQMSAALAVRLALLHKLTRSTMVIFDEPTQSMDGERRANLAEQIRRVRDFDQVIVISHDDTFEEGLDAVVWVQKDDGESRIDGGRHAPPLALPAFSLSAE